MKQLTKHRKIGLVSIFILLAVSLFAQRGTGLTVADYELITNPTYYQYYGEVLVGDQVTKTIELTNIGTVQAVVSGAYTNNSLFVVNTALPVYVQPGETKSIEVTFTPEEVQVASFDAQLTIVNAPDMDVQIINIHLSGYGKGALLAVTPKEFESDPTLSISTSEVLDGQFATVTLYHINKGSGTNMLSSFDVTLMAGTEEFIVSEWNNLPDSYSDVYTYYNVKITLSDTPEEVLHSVYFEKIGTNYELNLRLDQNPVVWGANLIWDVQNPELIGKVASFTVRSMYYGNLMDEFDTYYQMYSGTNYRYFDAGNYPLGYYFVTMFVDGAPISHTLFVKQ